MDEEIRTKLSLLIGELDTTRDFLDTQMVQINRGPGGREVALAITKIQEAQHWLLEACQQ